jgi:GNAT superfamily N-acetyltransferase
VTNLTAEIRQEPFDGPVATALCAALEAELVARYDNADACLSPHRVADYTATRGAFLVARLEGEPVGCGGLRPAELDGVGEVKRMYVVPRARGRGIGAQVLDRLTDSARELGYARLVLETGKPQPEAIALYDRAGWLRIPPYGRYRDSPLKVCFGREL